jgi:hypothetical protein
LYGAVWRADKPKVSWFKTFWIFCCGAITDKVQGPEARFEAVIEHLANRNADIRLVFKK